MPSEAALGQELWSRLNEAVGRDSPVLGILKELLKTYLNAEPQYIPAYELEEVVLRLGYQRETVWKDVIDLFCFKEQILELNFRLYEGDDHYEVGFETLQSIMSGDSVVFGKITYTSTAAQAHIYPYFIPTQQFHWLLTAERIANA